MKKKNINSRKKQKGCLRKETQGSYSTCPSFVQIYKGIKCKFLKRLAFKCTSEMREGKDVEQWENKKRANNSHLANRESNRKHLRLENQEEAI